MEASTPGQVIKALPPGKFAKLSKVIPSGTLEARMLSRGHAVFYWRYTLAGRTVREQIGPYDPSASPKALSRTDKGYSVQAAIRTAELLAHKHQQNLNCGGYAAIKAAEKEAARKAEAKRLEAEKFTLACLLADYADHLESLGRRSHSDVRSIAKLHVIEAAPEIALLPANSITGEQVADMMRTVAESGKGRTANKLRSYLRAAYQTARAARSKASIPVKFKGYNITHNPAADTEPDETQNRADKNPLSTNEMRAYWRAIKNMPGQKGAVLRLHLLTGGQRIEQLVNLSTANVTEDRITIYDGKGRPGKPARPLAVPLVAQAKAALRVCAPKGAYALSTDEGETHIAATTLSDWAVQAGAAAGIESFAAKRIRSGVETLLTEAGISKEVRGRLQSHGVSGVQDRHYNAYEYLAEKTSALQTLFGTLNVHPARKSNNLSAAKGEL